MSNEVLYTTYFNKQVTQVDASTERNNVAKKSTYSVQVGNSCEEKTKYYLRLVSNRIINPGEITIFELKKEPCKYVEVSKYIYDTYHNILDKKSTISFNTLEMRVHNA